MSPWLTCSSWGKDTLTGGRGIKRKGGEWPCDFLRDPTFLPQKILTTKKGQHWKHNGEILRFRTRVQPLALPCVLPSAWISFQLQRIHIPPGTPDSASHCCCTAMWLCRER